MSLKENIKEEIKCELIDIEDISGFVNTFNNNDSDDKSNFTTNEIISIRRNMLKYYKLNRRLLPWRGDIVDNKPAPPLHDGYGTWVSEIMLQQTRVETVISYYYNWMVKFPTIESLANSTSEEVNRMWAGLGYYRRAQQLLLGAKKVMSDYNGVLPSTRAELLTIPGIGPYTAGAISSIAFNQVAPLVDGNVIRVLSRLRALKSEVGTSSMDKLCWKLASELVDPNEPGDFNQSLMELGATICKPTSPSCHVCPVRYMCRGKLMIDYINIKKNNNIKNDFFSKKISNKRKIINVDNNIVKEEDDKILMNDVNDNLPTDISYFPQKKIKTKPREIIISVCIFAMKFPVNSSSSSLIESCNSLDSITKYLFVKRSDKGLLANQWEFPSVVLWEDEIMKNNKNNKENKVNFEINDNNLMNLFPSYFKNDLNIIWNNNNNNNNSDCITIKSTSKGQRFDPILHVFSHQRHNMHIYLQNVDEISNHNSEIIDITYKYREHRWFTSEEIRNIGITTGCKKILDTITQI